jgi:hypothetical protein
MDGAGRLAMVRSRRPVNMRVLPGGCRPLCRLSCLLAGSLALTKAAIRSFSLSMRLKPPWLLGTMATSACGMMLARSQARAGDQQDGHVDRAEFVVSENGAELRLRPVTADGLPHERHQLRLDIELLPRLWPQREDPLAGGH